MMNDPTNLVEHLTRWGVQMPSLRDLVKKEATNGKANREAVKALRKDFPTVAELLGGLEAKGDLPEVASGTITFYVHDGKVRATANVKDLFVSFVVDIPDLLEPWKCLEFALKSGECRQKEYTGQKAKTTPEQEKVLL